MIKKTVRFAFYINRLAISLRCKVGLALKKMFCNILHAFLSLFIRRTNHFIIDQNILRPAGIPVVVFANGFSASNIHKTTSFIDKTYQKDSQNILFDAFITLLTNVWHFKQNIINFKKGVYYESFITCRC